MNTEWEGFSALTVSDVDGICLYWCTSTMYVLLRYLLPQFQAAVRVFIQAGFADGPLNIMRYCSPPMGEICDDDNECSCVV